VVQERVLERCLAQISVKRNLKKLRSLRGDTVSLNETSKPKDLADQEKTRERAAPAVLLRVWVLSSARTREKQEQRSKTLSDVTTRARAVREAPAVLPKALELSSAPTREKQNPKLRSKTLSVVTTRARAVREAPAVLPKALELSSAPTREEQNPKLEVEDFERRHHKGKGSAGGAA
jgi:hypothetical protein